MMTPPGFLPEAKALLHKHGALLICDEVQVGLGRTGRFFSYQYDDVQPDIVTVAKALSGGYVPVGAMLTTDKIFSSVYSSMDKVMVHSTTFKGGPLAMAAGLAALAVIDDEGLVENAERRGAELMRGLEGLKAKYDLIQDVRGKGLIIGIEFGKPSGLKAKAGWAMLQKARVGLFAQMVVVALFQRHRILTQVSGDHMEVIKLIPPLMIGDAEVKLFLDGLGDVLEDASRGSGLMWDFGRTLDQAGGSVVGCCLSSQSQRRQSKSRAEGWAPGEAPVAGARTPQALASSGTCGLSRSHSVEVVTTCLGPCMAGVAGAEH